MISLRPHRIWLALLALAIVIMAGSGPAFDLARDEAEKNLADLKAAHAKTAQDLQQLRDNVAAARKLNGQMDHARAEQVLAPTDRLKAAEMLEREANAARVVHFTYTLAPEERVAINAGGETQNLAASDVTLAGDARDDVSVYGFVERVRQSLPGRARWQKLTITRNHAPLASGPNLHFEAELGWISNGATQTVAGGP